MPKEPIELTEARIAEIAQLNVIGKETIRDLVFTLRRREKASFIGGFRYYRQEVAKSEQPYDDIAQMVAEKGFEEFKGIYRQREL